MIKLLINIPIWLICNFLPLDVRQYIIKYCNWQYCVYSNASEQKLLICKQRPNCVRHTKDE